MSNEVELVEQTDTDIPGVDAALLSSYRRTAEDYQRLQAVVKSLHPLFEGFVARTQDGVEGTVLAPYVRVPADGRLDTQAVESLAAALAEFADRFRPDLTDSPEQWPVAEVAVGFFPTYVMWYSATGDADSMQAVLEDRTSGEVASKGSLRDVFAPTT